MKKIITEIMANRGYSVSRCADIRRVRALINRLHPHTTSKSLIRFGGDADGGYLVPDDLDGLVACFSPGVDVKASFEMALVTRGIPCYLSDASVAGPPITDPLIHFDKKFLGIVDDDTTIRMDKWVKQYAPSEGDLLLQMDIEGAEWPVLLNVSDEILRRFRIVVIELHSLERLIDKTVFEFMLPALDRLLRQFHVVHIHPNNSAQPVHAAGLTIPRLLEVTLLRQDRAQSTGYAKQFPHPLDRANVPDHPDFPLPVDWYRTMD